MAAKQYQPLRKGRALKHKRRDSFDFAELVEDIVKNEMGGYGKHHHIRLPPSQNAQPKCGEAIEMAIAL
jgi:hypothetical protein